MQAGIRNGDPFLPIRPDNVRLALSREQSVMRMLTSSNAYGADLSSRCASGVADICFRRLPWATLHGSSNVAAHGGSIDVLTLTRDQGGAQSLLESTRGDKRPPTPASIKKALDVGC